jgi:hypothetical protein
MTGGLLQIASAGLEDKYLTKNPEITFFKKVYRRYGNFSLEMKELNFDQTPEYDEIISLHINRLGDLLGKCFIEINIPKLHFTDNIINQNNFYFSIKNSALSNIQIKLDIYNNEYNNLKDFAIIEIEIYKFIKSLLKSQNLTIEYLKNSLKNKFTYLLNDREIKKIKIDNNLLNKINIYEYVFSKSDIINIENEIDLKYANLINELKYLYININDIQKEYNKINNGFIKYCFADNFAHNFINYFEIEIGGLKIEDYTNDTLNIYINHHLTESEKENYKKMTEIKNNNFDENIKEGKLHLPLIFWFNKDAINSLPLVSLRFSDVMLKFRISRLRDLIFFKDLKSTFEELLVLKVREKDHPKNNKGFIPIEGLIYDKFNYDKETRIFYYYCTKMNESFIKYKFLNIFSPLDISYILSFSSSGDGLDEYDFYNFIRNLEYDEMKYYFLGPNAFIDINLLYSMIPAPNIRFLGEYIFLDDVERDKFTTTELEYLIELHQENIFDVNNTKLYDNEIDFNKPIKELVWVFKLLSDNNGYDNFDRKRFLDYSDKKIVNKLSLYANNLEMIKFDINNKYYNYPTAYQYLNSENLKGVYYISYSLYPEESQPSGSVNFTILDGKAIKLELNEDFLNDYFSDKKNYNNLGIQLIIMGKNYNILKIERGYCKLLI